VADDYEHMSRDSSGGFREEVLGQLMWVVCGDYNHCEQNDYLSDHTPGSYR
jgi:hypothetical protein